MNVMKFLTVRTGCLVVVAASLAGCTTYVEQPPPPPSPAYVPPPATPAEVDLEIRTEADFYEPLRPYGRWEIIGPYGRCWVPARVEADWRPYCNGH